MNLIYYNLFNQTKIFKDFLHSPQFYFFKISIKIDENNQLKLNFFVFKLIYSHNKSKHLNFLI